jgi:hypothetical protein
VKRLRAEALKARILEVMAAMAARRPDQHEFTAQRVAIACGVSTTLL